MSMIGENLPGRPDLVVYTGEPESDRTMILPYGTEEKKQDLFTSAQIRLKQLREKLPTKAEVNTLLLKKVGQEIQVERGIAENQTGITIPAELTEKVQFGKELAKKVNAANLQQAEENEKQPSAFCCSLFCAPCGCAWSWGPCACYKKESVSSTNIEVVTQEVFAAKEKVRDTLLRIS